MAWPLEVVVFWEAPIWQTFRTQEACWDSEVRSLRNIQTGQQVLSVSTETYSKQTQLKLPCREPRTAPVTRRAQSRTPSAWPGFAQPDIYLQLSTHRCGRVAGERGLHSFLKECWSGTAARGLTDLGQVIGAHDKGQEPCSPPPTSQPPLLHSVSGTE